MIEGLIIAVIAGLLLAAFPKASQQLLRPEMIPFKKEQWPQWAKDIPRDEDVVLVLNHMRQDYVARGYEAVLRGRWPFRREMHADRQSEYALLMKRKP